MTKKQEATFEWLLGSVSWLLLLFTIWISYSYGLYSGLTSIFLTGIANIIVTLSVTVLFARIVIQQDNKNND